MSRYEYRTHLFELIYDKGYITLSNYAQDKGVNANILIVNLEDLINQVKANPPQFKQQINEEDEIEYLKILNRLRKNNKDNTSEDELEELALLQLTLKNKNKTSNKKEEPRVEAVKEVENEVANSIQEETISRFGEIVREVTNPIQLKKVSKSILESMKGDQKKGLKLDKEVFYFFELDEEDIDKINIKAQQLKQEIFVGDIIQIPYKFTAEALKDPTIKQQILNDKVVLTQDQIKYAPKPEGIEEFKKQGKLGVKLT